MKVASFAIFKSPDENKKVDLSEWSVRLCHISELENLFN